MEWKLQNRWKDLSTGKKIFVVMFKFFAGLMMVVSLNSCTEEVTKNDWTKDNLQDKVKSVTEVTTHIDTSLQEDAFVSRRKKTYNIYGNLTEVLGGSASEYWRSITYKYNDDGTLSEIRDEHQSDDGGGVGFKTTFQYNKEGMPSEEKVFYCTKFIDGYVDCDDYEKTIKYNYDRNGLIKEKVSFYEAGSDTFYIEKITFEYDKEKRVITENHFRPDGSLSYKDIYKYDNNGNKIEKNSYSSDDSLYFKSTFEYEYDEKDNWVRCNEKSYNLKYGFGSETTSIREYEYFDETELAEGITKGNSSNSVETSRSVETIEGTESCLIGVDWIYPSSSNPTGAWKFFNKYHLHRHNQSNWHHYRFR